MKKILIPVVMLLSSFTFSCRLEEDTLYKILVISSGGTFDGYYILDTDTPSFITASDIKLQKGTTSTYAYEKKLTEEKDNISITVTGDTVCSSLTLYLYEGDEQVGKVTDTRTESTDVVSVSLDYTFKNSDDEEDSE